MYSSRVDSSLSCRFVNDVLQIRKRIEDMFRRVPVKWPHWEVVVLSLPDRKLFRKILKGKERMADIEFFIIFSVIAFYLAVMPWIKRFDLFIQDAELSQRFFKECQWLFLAVAHFVCKLEAVVCLDALNGIWKLFYHMFQELGGRICALLLECFQVTEPAVFINERIIDNTFLQPPLRLDIYWEHISHQSGLFVPDTASFHKVSEYIWGLAV